MKAKTILLACLLGCFSVVRGADQLETWEFDVPGEYEVSNRDEIEVVEDQARLKRIPGRKFSASAEDYNGDLDGAADGTEIANLAMGPDVSIRLLKQGGGFQSPGVYVSRILDAGTDADNEWLEFNSSSFNTSLENAGGAVEPDDSVVALYHMDGNWQDSSKNANHGSSANGFSSRARLGTRSGDFWMGGRMDAGGISGLTRFTVSFWFYPWFVESADRGIAISFRDSANRKLGLRCGGSYDPGWTRKDCIGMVDGTGFKSSLTAEGTFDDDDAGQWNHIAVTYRQGASPPIQVYKNGVFLPLAFDNFYGPYNIDNALVVGQRWDGVGGIFGYIDDVAIFNKVLSASEVREIYERPRSLFFQVRSGSSVAELQSRNFIGPSGENSYFLGKHEYLASVLGFVVDDQFAQYKAFIYGTQDGTESPLIDFAGFRGSTVIAFDNTSEEFGQAETLQNVEVWPEKNTPFLSGREDRSGGYATNSTYTSRLFDGGDDSATWKHLSWTINSGISKNAQGITHLWPLDGTLTDTKAGAASSVVGGSPDWTSASSKTGTRALRLDGATSVDITTSLGTVKGLEFWVRTAETDCDLIQLNGSVRLVLRNGMVTPLGFGSGVTVYVNGNSLSRRLLAGWNHVAVSTSSGVTASDAAFGLAGGTHLIGDLDDIATYSRVLYPVDAKATIAEAVRDVGDRARLRVRVGDTLDYFDDPDVGWFGTGGDQRPDVFFEYDDEGHDLPQGVTAGHQYFQYRVFFQTDREVSPSVGRVRIEEVDGTVYVDDTVEEAAEGTFVGLTSKWVGDELTLLDRSGSPGLVNMTRQGGMDGLYHFDETSWSGGETDDDGGSRDANIVPGSGATPSTDAKVGLRSANLNAATAEINFDGSVLQGDFTVMLWFRSTDTTQAALVGRQDGKWVLEFNGDGRNPKPGHVSFVLEDDFGNWASAVSRVGDLNDGLWHHVAGVRLGQHIYVFVDGTMAGVAPLVADFLGLGSGSTLIGKHGPLGTYYDGLVDELAIFAYGLDGNDIRDRIAVGADRSKVGIFQTRVFDAEDRATWQTLDWSENAWFGNELTARDDVVGLWHLDIVETGLTPDGSGLDNDGELVGAPAPALNAGGKFDNCLSFSGGGQRVEVEDLAGDLRPAEFTVEAWVKLPAVADRVILEKMASATTGYALSTDSNGAPVFTVGDGSVVAQTGIMTGRWTHVAGTFDGTRARIYMNGLPSGSAAISNPTLDNSDLVLGQGGLADDFEGLMDEVAVYNRALTPTELADHARAGFARIRTQMRIADHSSMTNLDGSVAQFVGPDGTADTYFDLSGESLVPYGLPVERYAQVRVYIDTDHGLLAPRFQGLTATHGRFSTQKPWVAPVDSRAEVFVGRLLGFEHQMATNNTVRYMISGDNGTNWYYWGGSQWEADATGAGWNLANSNDVIDANIRSFYDQLYQGVGGVFKFRAFLGSDAIKPVGIEWVRLRHAQGRVVVTQPNGLEVGEEAWVVGVPYTIRWKSAGAISDDLRIDLVTKDVNGNDLAVQNLAPSVPNNEGDGGSFTTVIGTIAAANYYIRITDNLDESVTDDSDSPFQLVQDFRLTAPDGGERWYLTDTNQVQWESAFWPPDQDLGETIYLWFSEDAGTNWFRVDSSVSNRIGRNSYAWAADIHDPLYVSESALMGISETDVTGSPESAEPLIHGDVSDGIFTNAGIVVTFPTLGEGIRIGNEVDIQWKAAGAGATVKIELFDGNNWQTLTESYPCQPGINTYPVVMDVDLPTGNAKVRVTSNADNKVQGTSLPFTLADVRILVPRGGVSGDPGREQWQLGSTNYIQWTSGGASNAVDIEYSIDGGTNWAFISPLADNWTNVDSEVVTVTNTSPPWVVSGEPSSRARVRVTSSYFTNLYDVSGEFDITGVQVSYPAAGDVWLWTNQNAVTWNQVGIGTRLDISFAYELDPAPADYVFNTNANPRFGQKLIAPRSLERPTRKASVLLDAVQAPSNMLIRPVVATSQVFEVHGLLATHPTGGVVYTMGQEVPNGLQWFSAGADTLADVYYSSDGGASYVGPVLNDIQNKDDNQVADRNKIDFAVPTTVSPSPDARLKVVSAPYFSVSPAFAVRGIRIEHPAAGEVFDIGKPVVPELEWEAAMLSSTARVDAALSTAGRGLADPWPQGGLPQNLAVMSQSTADWTVDPQADPTTNAVVRFTVTSPPADQGLVMYSDPFVLRGVKVKVPGAGTVWDLGSTQTVEFLSAGLPVNTEYQVYYSHDGSSYDYDNPVQVGFVQPGVEQSFSWGLESSPLLTRTPSPTARLMLVAGGYTNVSQAFAVRGIGVTSPRSTDIWAITDPARDITWESEGVTGDFNVYFGHWNSASNMLVDRLHIGTNVSVQTFSWDGISADLVGPDAVIQVTGGGYTGWSALFEIVAEATIRIISPAPGDFFQVGTTRKIRWSQGGEMSNDFLVTYAFLDDLGNPQTLLDGAAPEIGGLSEVEIGPITSKVGQVRLRIVNNDEPTISAQTDDFYIGARFGMEQQDLDFLRDGLIALRPVDVTFTVYGEIDGVDLYYSTDQDRAPDSWRLITEDAPIASPGHDKIKRYPWTVPDEKSDTVWLRIQDTAYRGRSFEADETGPFTDFGVFAIKRYLVTWNVTDAVTGEHLDRLGVGDGSGWSEASLSSPVVREYPYGIWNTVWTRQYYERTVVFEWASDSNKTINVAMERSEIEPEANVLADFFYDGPKDELTAHAWLERAGNVVDVAGDPERQCTFRLYDTDGTPRTNLVTTTVLNGGVFRYPWTNVTSVLDYGEAYYARVEIRYSGDTFSSLLTYTVRLTADQEQTAQILAAIQDSEASVTSDIARVASNVNTLVEGQGAIRSTLGGISNNTATLLEDTGIIKGDVQQVEAQLTDVIVPNLNTLTDKVVGVIGPMVTDIDTDLNTRYQEFLSTSGRILSRPERVVYGDSITVLYKSKAGYVNTVEMTVTNSVFGQVDATFMSEIVSGIYQGELEVDWVTGPGSYVVRCQDPVTASPRTHDSMVLEVVTEDYYSGAGGTGFAGLSNRLASIDFGINMLTNTQYSLLTNMAWDLTWATGELAEVSEQIGALGDLSDVADRMNQITGAIGTIGSLTNLGAEVAGLNSVMIGVSNALQGTDWGDIVWLTNAVANATNLLGRTDPLVLDYLQFASNRLVQLDLGPIGEALAEITSSWDVIAGVTNISGQLSGVTADLAQVDFPLLATEVTSLKTALVDPGIDYAALDASVKSLSDDLVPKIASDVEIATNDLQRLVGHILTVDLNAMASNALLARQGVQGLSGLEDIVDNLDALSNSLERVLFVTNLAVQVEEVTNALSGVDWGDIRWLMDHVGWTTNRLLDLDVGDLAGQLGEVTGVLAQVRETLDDFDLDTLNTGMRTVTGAVGDVSFPLLRTQLGELHAALSNADWGDVQYATNRLSALDQIIDAIDEMTSLTGSLNRVLAVTNLQPTVDGIWLMATNIAAKTDPIAAMDFELGLLADAVGDIGSYSNEWELINTLVGRSAYLSNLTQRIASYSNEWALIGSLGGGSGYVSNMVARIAAYSNEWDRLAFISNVVADIAGGGGIDVAGLGYVSNLLDNVAAYSNEWMLIPEVATDVAVVTNILLNVDWDALGQMEVVTQMLTVIERRLGTPADEPGEETFAARLAGLTADLESVGADAAAAATAASSAKTKATDAATRVGQVKDLVAAGDMEQARTVMQQVRALLASAQAEIGTIVGKLGPGALHEEMTQTAKAMETFAASMGYKWLVDMKQPPAAVGPEAVGTGDLTKEFAGLLKDNITSLQSDLKAMNDKLNALTEVTVDTELIGFEGGGEAEL